MSKVRTLTIQGAEYRVDNFTGILDSGKFYGLMPHAIRDYDSDYHNESFGESDHLGFYWMAEKSGGSCWSNDNRFRYYSENTYGQILEISAKQYEAAKEEQSEADERESRIEEVADQLHTLENEEQGQCDECGDVVYVQGVRTHAHGCPKFARIKALRKTLETLEG